MATKIGDYWIAAGLVRRRERSRTVLTTSRVYCPSPPAGITIAAGLVSSPPAGITIAAGLVSSPPAGITVVVGGDTNNGCARREMPLVTVASRPARGNKKRLS
ncbi:MAG: hypothetical protein IPP25_08870 [Saprospiraceae bacterium]|nr:hypothetical protein [Candidatus Opimibacter skivensis]